jgi:hypothetical protein
MAKTEIVTLRNPHTGAQGECWITPSLQALADVIVLFASKQGIRPHEVEYTTRTQETDNVSDSDDRNEYA